MATSKEAVRAIVKVLGQRADVAAVYAAADAAGMGKNPGCAKYKTLTDIFAAAGIAKSAFKRACNMLPLWLKSGQRRSGGQKARKEKKERKERKVDGSFGGGAGAEFPTADANAAPALKRRRVAADSGGVAHSLPPASAPAKGGFKRLHPRALQRIATFLTPDEALALSESSKTTHQRLGATFLKQVKEAHWPSLMRKMGVEDKTLPVGHIISKHEREIHKGRLTKAMIAEGWSAYGKYPYRRRERFIQWEVTGHGPPILYVHNYYTTLEVNLQTGAWRRDNFTISHNGEDRVRDTSKPMTNGVLKKPFTAEAIRALVADVPQTGYNKLTLEMRREPVTKYLGPRMR